MEKLKGSDSIGVVSSRFSDGYDVVGCVLDFYKGMAEIENMYASSVTKLLNSVAYTFHSNVFMKWLGSEPFGELGTVKDGWQKLGKELEKLAGHHAEKAAGYANLLRQPLSDLLPRLDGMRKTIRTRGKELVSELEQSTRKHKMEKQNYMKCGNRYEKMVFRVSSSSSDPGDTKYSKQQDELRSLSDTLKHQEALYQSSVYELASTQKNFNKDLASLYKSAELLELERVNALEKSLQEFAKILSNTAPSYLECMQRIVFSVADIDAQRDVNSFVNDHKHLMTEPQLPQFEPHQCRKHVYPTTYIPKDAPTAVSQATSGTTERTITPNEKNLSSKEVKKTERSVELPTPVEDHFKSGNEDKSVVIHDEQPTTSSTGDKIKAFTKKLKFWSQDKSRNDDTANETAADDTLVHSDEAVPKSVDDEIEAILSTPKKKTKQTTKQSSKKPSVEASDEVTPADVNSHKDQSLPDKKQEREASLKQKTASRGAPDDGMVEQPTTRELKELKSNTGRQSIPADSVKPLVKQKPTIAVKPKPSSKPQPAAKPQAHIAPIQKDQPLTAESMFKQLEQKVAENDYYQLLGLEESASAEEIARRRRERSRELHPDHFMTDTVQKAKAEEELILINQMYTDVLSKEKSRELYNQLCRFRKFYRQILTEQGPRLQNAKERMGSLRDSLRKAKTPLALQEEVDLAVKLIQLCLDQHS